jgi:hypothetical protein
MTDLNERLAAMLDGEPDAPNDLERVVRGGRRALRRRNTLTAVAGTAGTAAVTAAIVVPIAGSEGHSSGSPNTITVLASTTPVPSPPCKAYFIKVTPGERKIKEPTEKLMKEYAKHQGPTGYSVKSFSIHKGGAEVLACPPGAIVHNGQPVKPTAPTPTTPSYTYSADPQTLADRFAAELHKQVTDLGFTIIYGRPFAQETSTLDSGHPTYYDGNVDVQLPGGPADIGVQVTHETTGLVPFDSDCNPSDCTRTKLPDGSIEQISHIDAGAGGAEVIAVAIHHPDGLVVEAQGANYAFGPEATKARSSQPLTIDQLTALAADPAFAF